MLDACIRLNPKGNLAADEILIRIETRLAILIAVVGNWQVLGEHWGAYSGTAGTTMVMAN